MNDPVTLGVDLAAKPSGTAVVAITWHPEGPRAQVLFDGVDDRPEDEDLLRVMAGEHVVKVGVDCPFGWPVGFAKAICSHHESDRRWTGGRGDLDRRRLRYRETDRAVGERFRMPLSVSSDRIGVTAMRWASVMDEWEHEHGEIDRTGVGRLVEVYPAAALRSWQLTPPGDQATKDYKKQSKAGRHARGAVLERLRKRLPTLVQSEFDAACAREKRGDDVLDALAAALVAAAVATTARVHPAPDAEQKAYAEIEGWIALPEVDLEDIALPGEHGGSGAGPR